MEYLVLVGVLASFAYTYWKLSTLPQPKVPPPKEIEGPTSTEGTAIPVVFGDVEISDPAVLWWGDRAIVKIANGELIRSPETEQSGVEYYLGMHLGLCHGKLDELTEIYYGRLPRLVTGTYRVANAQRGITVDRIAFFGYDGTYTYGLDADPECCAPAGNMMVKLGQLNDSTEDQGVSNYISDVIVGYGQTGPTYHGVASLVLCRAFFGASPYIKPMSARVKRIHTTNGGNDTQWYDSKAEITCGADREDVWKYNLVAQANTTDYSATDYDDSAWRSGPGGVGNAPYGMKIKTYNGHGYPLPRVRTQLLHEDNWGGSGANNLIGEGEDSVAFGCKLWLRRDLGPMQAVDLGVQLWHDDGVKLFFNGIEVAVVATVDPNEELHKAHNSTATVPAALVNTSGPNIVAVRVQNTYYNDGISWNLQSTQRFIYAGAAIGPNVTTPARVTTMNAAHVIHEVLTDTVWGRGYPDAEIDDSAFRAAADTCYSEGLGISYLWKTPTEYKEFLDFVLRHIGGVLFTDRSTGLIVLKLLRDNYTVANLPAVGPDEIVSVEGFTRRSIAELTNTVTVRYSATTRGDTGTVHDSDAGLISVQGGAVDTTIDLGGIRDPNVAMRRATAELKALSTQVISCTLVGCRELADLDHGDVFVFSWPDLFVTSTVMRVVAVDLGSSTDPTVKVQCVEDVFAHPRYSLRKPSATVPTSLPPTSVSAGFSTVYYPVEVQDPNDKGWLECGFNASSWGEASVFAGFTEISPGVWEADAAGPLSENFFDRVNPFNGILGSIGAANGQYMVGRVVLAFELSTIDPQLHAQGPYVVDDIGGYFIDYGGPGHQWVDTKARLHRATGYTTGSSFTAGMTWHLRNGNTYGDHYVTCQTENVVLGTTPLTMTVADASPIANPTETMLLAKHQVSSRHVVDGYREMSVTMANGWAGFPSAFLTVPGTPGATSIPAGTWRVQIEGATVTGGDVGHTTTLGFRFLKVPVGASSSLLFEVQSRALDPNAATGEPVGPLSTYFGDVPLSLTDRILFQPGINTDSTTPVTVTLLYCSPNRGTTVTIPTFVAAKKAAQIRDAANFPVEIDDDGAIVDYGDNRNLLVTGGGELAAIYAGDLEGGSRLWLTFDADTTIAPDDVAGSARVKSELTFVPAGSVCLAALLDYPGGAREWSILSMSGQGMDGDAVGTAALTGSGTTRTLVLPPGYRKAKLTVATSEVIYGVSKTGFVAAGTAREVELFVYATSEHHVTFVHLAEDMGGNATFREAGATNTEFAETAVLRFVRDPDTLFEADPDGIWRLLQ